MALHVDSCSRCLEELDAVDLEADVLLCSLRAFGEGSTSGRRTAQVSANGQETSLPPARQTSLARFENLPAEFGRYQLLKALGRGGMGAVFLAHDTQLDRTVALKVPFLDAQESDSGEQRFFREARAAATIEHPHVCPVFDVGTIDGMPFLTMPYINGETLSQKLKGGWRPSRRDVARLGMMIADGLALAHRRGVIHRDVKPGNILLDEKNKPLLTDFGLARRHRLLDGELTRSGQIVGSPLYMSPEQASGDQNLIGPASDQYSLAIVMFELLTGRPPFRGSLLDVLDQIRQNDIPRISEVRGDAPDQLDAIVAKATSRAIRDRYGSMEELARDLKSYVRSGVVQTNAPKVVKRKPPTGWPRVTTAIAGIGAMLVLAAVVVIIKTSGGTVEVQLHERGTELRILQGDRELAVLKPAPESQQLPLAAGTYRVEIVGGDGTQQPSPAEITVHWGGHETIRIVPKAVEKTEPAQAINEPTVLSTEKPTREVAANPPQQASVTTPDFTIPVTGIPSVTGLAPTNDVEQWRQPNVFANLATSGGLQYPELPAEDYVFETDFELVTPGGFLIHEFGEVFYRVLILFEWDAGKSLYRCRLQRRHGKGSWFLHWRHFKAGERVNLRLVRYQGVALLFDRDRQILDIDSAPVKPQLKITYGGETPREGTIFSCGFRSLTADEQKHAQSELTRIRPPQLEPGPMKPK
ncbi:MAG: serine/threonine protein kinase [Planctomycetaceae bacterium]|nr:serine/threonine protein kinase [Planctomycetaceae bacterium]